MSIYRKQTTRSWRPWKTASTIWCHTRAPLQIGYRLHGPSELCHCASQGIQCRYTGSRLPEAGDRGRLRQLSGVTRGLRFRSDIDSMDRLNFVIALHKEFNVDIPEADYQKLETVEDCVNYLVSHAGSASDRISTPWTV